MKRFGVEGVLPGAVNLSFQGLQAMAKTFCLIINFLGKRYYRIQTFITDNKIYCIHSANDEAPMREHSMLSCTKTSFETFFV